MAQTYTRQSTFADGDTITAALFNDEYNQLVNAFAYSSSSASSTGHRHDGTAGQGGNIHTIGDLDFLNKIVVDSTNNRWGFYVEVSSSAVEQIRLQDGALLPVTDSDVDLGTSSLYFKDAYIDSITTTGNVAVGGNLTVTGTTTFNGGTITMGDAATDNVVFGADVDSNIIPDDDDTYDLGSSSQQWRNIFIDGTAEIDTLALNGTTVTSTAAELNILDGVTSTAAELNLLDGVTSTTAELNILDGVTSTAAELNILDGVTSTAAELNILDGVTATAAEINALDGITSTVAELNILDGVTASAADINLIDGITNGTVIASKAIITDANKDITGGRNITISGELDAATLDISGDADIDGTLEADAITIGGVTLAETISDTVGAMVTSNTETGVTVTYDDSDNTLDFVIGTLNQDTTGLAATATALATARTIGGTSFDGTANISVGLADTATALATARTIHGVSFDGTANIDLSEVIQDTVGAMVSSNTETNITVTYQDSDGTLDFAFSGSADTTGNAATATALETARTIHGVSFDGTANIDLTEVVQDTVGAMFSSNTESGITVAYEDSDGTIDLTVGTLNQNTTGSAATLTTARTIGGVSFDGSANITPTTFTTATFSGDVNVDSGVLFVDVSENRIGINQTSPDVSLDLGANTDSIHVPVGTTAQRPGSPAAGYFRYNSTTGGFEGYTDEWGAIAGGGGGTAPVINTMTGDGSDTTLSLSVAPTNENATFVTLDGVLQHKDTYSVSGSTLTFSTAPPTGVKVECITLTTTSISTATTVQDADADTKIQVEESSDEDKIRFDTGGTERMVLDSTSLTVTPKIVSDAGVEIDNITIDGTEIDLSSGSLTVDAAQNIILDHDSGHSLVLAGSGTSYGSFFINNTTNLAIATAISGAGIEFFANGSERMKIASDGKVGIGTSSPNRNLTVFASSSPVLNVKNSNADLHLEMAGENAYVGNSSSSGFLQLFTNNGSSTSQFNADGSFQIGAASIANLKFSQSSDVISITAKKDGTDDIDLAFITQASGGTAAERMRIKSDGKVGIGTTAPEYIFHAKASGAGTNFKFQTAGGGDTLYIDLTTSGGTGFIGKAGSSLEFYPQGTISVEFANGGNAKCVGSFLSNQSLSDMRLKENVKPITNALYKVRQLEGLTWKYKKDGTVNTGLSADKLIEILPEAVGEDTLIGDDNGEKYKHINYGNTVGLLVEAIKEQQEQIEALQSKINTLKGGE